MNETEEDDIVSSIDDKETTHVALHETIISNPGIAERLEQDIECFDRYGFTFRRDQETGNSLFTSPSVPSDVRPFASLQIHVSDVSLVASVGPFLRTFVRLCVHPIRPQSLLATVLIKECIGSSGSSSSRRRNPARKKTIASATEDCTTAARSVAHAIHMLIRNSMGAALFLRLKVILPKGHGVNGETGLRRNQVLSFMEQNDDGCYEYPSVEICEYERFISQSTRANSDTTESFSVDLGLIEEFKGAPPSVTKPLKLNCLEGYDPSRHVLDLTVSTRMCTVRLTPVLYDLSQRLLISLLEDSINQSNNNDVEQGERFATLMICVEKVSNLYRILMLIRDYCKNLFKECEDCKPVKQPELVIICKSEDLARRFERETKKFIANNFIDRAQSKTSSGLIWAPRVLSVAKAVDFLVSEVTPLPVIGFDLHEDAATLSKTNSDATRLLALAGAVLLGYESDGIPKELDAKLTHYIQIDSRTSINVVAAFSILCHLVLH